MLQWLKDRARDLKRQLTVLYYASVDPRLPWYAKVPIAAALLYALSPIDFIPDFIPVLGYLDDLLILPGLILLALRLIPQEVLESARERAEAEPIRLKARWAMAGVFIAVWAVILFAIARAIIPLSKIK